MTAEAVEIIKEYGLEEHPEGGYFAEVYTAPFEKDRRPLAGSIYFLLDEDQLSHLHEIDCDEIWYYHEGCGLKITVLTDEGREELLLGPDFENGERMMVTVPAGTVFGSENIKGGGYTFVSCATTPKFDYAGFRLIGKKELSERWPDLAGELEYLAY